MEPQVSDTSQDPAYSLNGTRRGIALMLLPATSVVALVPAWAGLCGATAARDARWPWQMALEPQALIAFALVLFIVQVLWSTGQGLLIESTRNVSPTGKRPDQPPPSRTKHRRPRLPYTTPWSPLGRLGWRWRAAPLTESARWTLALLPLLVLGLSALIGWQMIVLSLAATALTLIEWRVARRGHTVQRS